MSFIKLISISIFFLFTARFVFAQDKFSSLERYEKVFSIISNELKENGSFKNSVYLVEYSFDTSLLQSDFDRRINVQAQLVNDHFSYQTLNGKMFYDSIQFLLNNSLFHILKDTVEINAGTKKAKVLPFVFGFSDPLGKQDFRNVFVSKLLLTKTGNCQSLAYLYKILADEVGAKCWLALAPNHIYIRNYSPKIGWYNTELTSGTFPTDAWIMATGYVSPQAIRSGLYMDTLSNQQAIALCVLDLAKGYELQTKNYYDGFILKCCELVLQYHPVNPMALLLKAETLKKVYLKEQADKYPKPTVTFNQMQEAYITLAKLGYREMPEKMYQQWLKSMTTDKEKYSNKKMTKPSTKSNPPSKPILHLQKHSIILIAFSSSAAAVLPCLM